MLLWLRKKFRVVRVGRAKLWMKAHIWLGLLCVPLLVLHSGFRGWNLALAGILMAVLLIVIASGVWGLALQQILPTIMLDEIPPRRSGRRSIDVLRQLWMRPPACTSHCGHPVVRRWVIWALARAARRSLVIGAVRSVGRVQGKVLQRGPRR